MLRRRTPPRLLPKVPHRETAELGDRVRDKITGLEGLVTGGTQYITGCDQLLVQPPMKEDGTYRDGHWVDIDRLEVLERGVIKLEDVAAPELRRVGPDAPAPIK